ncbi:MAG: BatA domain-containing protein [Planctomycetales bacterium]
MLSNFPTPLNPALLGGLLLASIPILLHLILRQKPKRMEFPALRFLQKREQANKTRLLWRHLWLLFCRVMVVCLLVFALARPRCDNAGIGILGDREQPVAAAMVFDTSPRSAYRSQNESRIQAAQQIARRLLEELPDDSQAAVLDSRLGYLTAGQDRSMVLLSPTSAGDRVEKLAPTASPADLSVTMQSGLQVLQDVDEKFRREMYVFTDLSRSAWSAATLRKIQASLGQSHGVAVHVIDVGVEKPSNNALEDARLSSQVVPKNSPVTLTARVHREGAAERRSIELWLDNKQGAPERRGAQTVELSPDSPQTVEFALPLLPEGVHQGFLKIAGKDGLELDDRQFFSLEVKPAWKVLLVSADPEDAVYLRNALAPRKLAREGRARYRPDWVPLEGFPQRTLIGKYAAVCLLDPPPVSADAWNHLREFVEFGGGAAIFLGRNARRDVKSFNTTEAQALLPGPLFERVARRPDGGLYLVPKSHDHPMLSEFRELETQNPWSFFPVFRYWQFEGDDPPGIVIRYNDRSPALVEKRIGKGRAVTMTTTISDSPNRKGTWNELVADWPFVMLAEEMMNHLAGGSGGRMNYSMGQSASLSLPAETPRTRFLLQKPDGRAARIHSDADSNRLRISRAQIPQPGNYLAEATVNDQAIVAGFSVNLLPRTTRLERISQEEIKEGLGESAPVQFARGQEEINRAVGKARVGNEWFEGLVLLLSLFLAVEYVFANRFYGS